MPDVFQEAENLVLSDLIPDPHLRPQPEGSPTVLTALRDAVQVAVDARFESRTVELGEPLKEISLPRWGRSDAETAKAIKLLAERWELWDERRKNARPLETIANRKLKSALTAVEEQLEDFRIQLLQARADCRRSDQELDASRRATSAAEDRAEKLEQELEALRG